MQPLTNALQPATNLSIAATTIWSKVASDIHVVGTHLFGKRKNDVDGIAVAIHQCPTHRVVKRVQGIAHVRHSWSASILEQVRVDNKNRNNISVFGQCTQQCRIVGQS